MYGPGYFIKGLLYKCLFLFLKFLSPFGLYDFTDIKIHVYGLLLE